jgi:hypothetical protein
MKVVYIAGPFRAADAWAVENNIRRAEVLGFQVATLGAMPLIPHTNTRFFDGTLTGQFWLDGTMELLRRCDAVLTTDDWERSVGARGEVAEAARRHLPVFHTPSDLSDWLNGR